MDKSYPIGIIDSGLGGLTIAKEIQNALPYESILYLGDSINTPYGEKSDREIYSLAVQMIQFLIEKKVKLIVIACNTITVTSLAQLRNTFPYIPIVGVVPVIKKAVQVTQNKTIGILSTTKTAKSRMQKDLINKYADGCIVINRGTDRIVPLLENGLWHSKKLTSIVRQVLREYKRSNVDTLVLGCTHYPFVAKEIQEIMGKGVQILDSGGAIGRQVNKILQTNKLKMSRQIPRYLFFTTGSIYTLEYMLEHSGLISNGKVKTISL